jgi:hypothetical protein
MATRAAGIEPAVLAIACAGGSPFPGRAGTSALRGKQCRRNTIALACLTSQGGTARAILALRFGA